MGACTIWVRLAEGPEAQARVSIQGMALVGLVQTPEVLDDPAKAPAESAARARVLVALKDRAKALVVSDALG